MCRSSTILECKYIWCDGDRYNGVCRSSTILECKFLHNKFSFNFSTVEVAPYWNVNLNISLLFQNLRIVEVAPYWNVNEDAIAMFGPNTLGRSSTILECKLMLKNQL